MTTRPLLSKTTWILTIGLLAVALAVSTVPAVATGPAQEAGQEDDPNVIVAPELFGAMKYRSIGPSRGGRSTAVAGVPSDPLVYYFGATGGGVWKTTSAGQEWENVSDGFFGVGSIGAIAVADSDPNVVYVGTGSACPRGNVSVGDGVYKSTDAGRTWMHIGLPDAGQVGRIRVHPANPDLVYIAALGHIFGPNEERGVYRSQDGGETWELVLHVSREVGAIDLAMNPENPRELYAAMWRAERKPWTMIDGGEGSGLYKSTDSGDTWKNLTDPELDNGLPTGLIGRIGVTIAPANPDRVWALVGREGDDGGLYRSDDAGKSWSHVSDNRELITRGWYYNHVTADSQDPDTLYVNNGGFFKSIDGGRTWGRVRTPHGDNHDVWINPNDPRIMIQANDGGANVTMDGGETWSTQLNQPTAEFYRVTVDNQFPYRVYGAQQDNSTISIPMWSSGTLTPFQDWHGVAGGESGHIAVHPDDPDLVYSGNYIGRIDRYQHASNYSRNVLIYPEMQDGTAVRDLKHRFQWNAPIRFSPHDPEVIYHTSHMVHRSRDGGMSWETISPDLTRNEPEKQDLPGGPIQHDHTGVEVFNTIFAFEESPHTAGVLWAGADDGLVHISRDNGATWEDITPPDMQIDSTVNTIAISPHQAGRAFIAVHRYRMDDMKPYIWRTDDYGATWEFLTDGTNGIPADHPVRAIVEDPDRRGLLYAGTEFGMFVSFDDGAHWQSLQLNLPVVPVTDLTVHRQDLVVATQGRSFWILDDLTPLHQITDEVATADAYLFDPRDAYHTNMGGGRRGGATGPFAGVFINYYLADEPDARAKLEILDSSGDLLRTFWSEKPEGAGDEEAAEAGATPGSEEAADSDEPNIPAKTGMNQFVWDKQVEGPDVIEGAQFSLAYTGGYFVVPGTYQVRLTIGDWSQTHSFDVLKDPRQTEVTQADLQAQFDLLTEISAKLTETHDAIRTLRSVRSQVKEVAGRAKDVGLEYDFTAGAKAIGEKLTDLENELIQVRSTAGQDPINFPPKLDDQIAYLYTYVFGAYGRPTQGAYERFDDLNAELTPLLHDLQQVLMQDVAAFNEQLQAHGAAGIIFKQGPGS
jgi:photosystem II stability/assembly factor-like uncharacterized protein